MNIPKSLFQLLLGKRLPITGGTLQVTGVQGDVLIRRDRYGIAYVEAGNDEDAWFGLGFCQGQDRAFQLEQILRLARGRLAELVGADGLPFDRVARRLGFHRLSMQQLEILDEDVRRGLEAFARGVTQGMRSGCRKPAHEFALLGLKQPTEYLAADVLSRIRIMGFGLPTNWDAELVRLKILLEDGPQALQALEPVYPEWLPVTTDPLAQAGPAGERLADELAAFQSLTGGAGGGSNNWAVAASRTATGRPLLANDPHLAPLLPSHWYLTHVRTPEWAIAGPSFVGAPLFAIGHNGFAAWGVTAGMIDNTDLFIEEVGPDGQSAREGDAFVPCEVVREVIHIKGGQPVEEKVLITRRGPIVGPALEGEVGAISMRATWLDVRPINGWFKLHRTRSFEQFRRYFESFPALSLNVAYADASGTIAWQLVGDTPQRRQGWGMLPGYGRDPEAGWEDELLPFDALPHIVNPDIGFVASANNQPVVSGGEPFLGMDSLDGYRFARITEALQSRTDWDVASTHKLQLDQLCLPWREMREVVLEIQAGTPEATQALALLRDWDGILDVDSPAASVFELFVAGMIRRIVEAKAPRAASWVLGRGFSTFVPVSGVDVRRMGHLSRLLRQSPPGWLARPWAEEIEAALTQAIRTLNEKHGPDPAKWGWGKVRPLTLQHPVGARQPMDKVFNLGPFPWGGDANTVAQTTSPLLDPLGAPYIIASLRMVVDVGNWDACSFVLPGGQSGNPFSPHYDDLLPLWQRGEGVPIAWSSTAVEQAAQTTLRLAPAD